MLFPTLAGQAFTEIHLDQEASVFIEEYEQRHGRTERSPLLNPSLCQQFIDALHRREDVCWSYGGYLEDRSHLWRGSYLEKSGDFIHLGVDFHVPQGTPLITEYDATVILADDDGDLDGGWGQRIFLKPVVGTREGVSPPVVLIYAHLQQVVLRPGQELSAGTVLAEVGGPPHNGNWSPHLHIQALRYDHFARILQEGFENLDGYGHPNQVLQFADLFPNPLSLLTIEK